MKASTPSLILFFLSSFLTILFREIDCDNLIIYTKSIIIPSLFIYYFVSNNYKITLYKGIIFLMCFSREVFLTLDIKETPLGALVSILTVYHLLLYYFLKDFRRIKFHKKDISSTLIYILIAISLCFSVLNLKLENLSLSLSVYVYFGIILCILAVIVVIGYTKKGGATLFYAMLMCMCFVVADMFYMIYNFYMNLNIINIAEQIAQTLSYLFMVKYFLEKDK